MFSTSYNHVIDTDSSQPLYEMGIFMYGPLQFLKWRKWGSEQQHNLFKVISWQDPVLLISNAGLFLLHSIGFLQMP